MPVFMLLDVTHVFAYSLPVESLHFPGGILNVACCSPCQRAEVTAGAALVQTPPKMGLVFITKQPQALAPPWCVPPLSYVSPLIFLPQTCMSITGQVRFKQELSVQTVFSSHTAALGRRVSRYASL